MAFGSFFPFSQGTTKTFHVRILWRRELEWANGEKSGTAKPSGEENIFPLSHHHHHRSTLHACTCALGLAYQLITPRVLSIHKKIHNARKNFATLRRLRRWIVRFLSLASSSMLFSSAIVCDKGFLFSLFFTERTRGWWERSPKTLFKEIDSVFARPFWL